MGILAQTCPNGTHDQAQGPILCPRRPARGPRWHICPGRGVEHCTHGIGVCRDSRLAPYLCGLLQRICSSQAEQPCMDPPAQGVQVHRKLPNLPPSQEKSVWLSSCPQTVVGNAAQGILRRWVCPWLPSPMWMIVA